MLYLCLYLRACQFSFVPICDPPMYASSPVCVGVGSGGSQANSHLGGRLREDGYGPTDPRDNPEAITQLVQQAKLYKIVLR